MAQPLGSQAPSPSSVANPATGAAGLRQPKKKGCKQTKCSKWKGGKCRCGRE
jgi:hypothetical protein